MLGSARRLHSARPFPVWATATQTTNGGDDHGARTICLRRRHRYERVVFDDCRPARHNDHNHRSCGVGVRPVKTVSTAIEPGLLVACCSKSKLRRPCRNPTFRGRLPGRLDRRRSIVKSAVHRVWVCLAQLGRTRQTPRKAAARRRTCRLPTARADKRGTRATRSERHQAHRRREHRAIFQPLELPAAGRLTILAAFARVAGEFGRQQLLDSA